MQNDQQPQSTSQPGLQPGSFTNNDKVVHPVSTNLQSASPTPATNPNVEPTTPTQPAASPSVATFAPNANQPAAPANTVSSDGVIGLTGSQIVRKKERLPIGIYFIAGFNFLGFVISFIDTSQNSTIFTVAMLADLILAIGLILRLEVARKIMLWLLGITLVLVGLSMVLLFGLQQKIQTAKTNYQTAVSKIDQNKLTPSQKQELATLQTNLNNEEKQAGKAIAFTYIKLGVSAVESVIVFVYLTRPKVKAVFTAVT